VLRLSLSTGALYHLPLRTVFALARGAGLDGIELVFHPEIMLRGGAYVQRLSREFAIPVLSVHPSVMPYPGYNQVSSILPRLVSLAEEVECHLVVLHTPKVTTLDDPRWSEFVQVLLHERARVSPGVSISLENSGFFHESDARYILNDVRKLRAFADEQDLPLTFDTAHAGTSPYRLMDAYRVFAERLVNVHFSDLVPRRFRPDWRLLHTFLKHHQMPGEGVLPLDEFVRTVLGSGYAGPMTLEISPIALGAWSLPRVRRRLAQAIQFVRRLEAQSSAAQG
jgi:sugar phosphate isomerase/epimerase